MAEITKKQLSLDSVWSFLGSISSAIFGLGHIVVVGNAWGRDGLGIFSMAISVYFIGSMLANVGIHTAVIFELAKLEKRDAKNGAVISTSLLGSLALGLLVGGVSALFSRDIATFLNQPTIAEMLFIFCLALPLFLLSKTLVGVFNAIRNLKIVAFSQLFRGLGTFTFLVVAAQSNWELNSIACGFVLVEGLISLWLFVLILAHFPLGLPSFTIFRRLLSFGWKTGLSGVLTDINSRLDVLIIGYFWSTSVIGVYALAANMARGIWVFAGAIQRVTNPLFVKLFEQKDFDRIQNILTRLVVLAAPFFFIFGLGLAATAEFAIGILFPNQPEMLGALFPLYYLLPGALLFACITMIGSAPSSSIGKPENAVKMILGVLGANLVLNIALVPSLGAEGAAIATSFSLVVATAIFGFYSVKELQAHLPYYVLVMQFLLSCLGAGIFQFYAIGIPVYQLLPVSLASGLLLLIILGLLGRDEFHEGKNLLASVMKN
ncbi:MAG: flippase [Oceanicoccus sp.]